MLRLNFFSNSTCPLPFSYISRKGVQEHEFWSSCSQKYSPNFIKTPTESYASFSKEKYRQNFRRNAVALPADLIEDFQSDEKTSFDIVKALKNSGSIDEILKIIDVYVLKMKPVELATAFFCLAKKGFVLNDENKTNLVEDSRVRDLARKIEENIHKFNAQGVANVAWAHGKLGHGTSTFNQTLYTQALEKATKFRPVEVSMLMNAFGKSDYPCSNLLKVLTNSKVKGKTQFFFKNQLKDILWAHARHDIYEVDLFNEILAQLIKEMASLELSTLVPVLWSCAKVGHRDVDFLSQSILRLKELKRRWNPQDVSNMAWAFWKLGFYDKSMFQLIAEESTLNISCFNDQVISTIAWSFAGVKHYDKRLMTAIAKRTVQVIPESSPTVIGIISQSFAHLSHYEKGLFDSLICHSEPKISSFHISALSALLYSLAIFGLREKNFLEVVAREMVKGRMLEGAGPEQLVQLAWSFSVLDFFPPAVIPLLRRKLARIQHMEPHQLCQLYQVELVMRLECQVAASRWPWEKDAYEFLESLWLGGYLRSKAIEQWQMHMEKERTVSNFQRQISIALKAMGINHLSEFSDGDFSVDIAIIQVGGPLKVAIEADGPTHFASNDRKLVLGPTLLRRRMLRHLGWNLVEVPYFEWPGMAGRITFLREKLKVFNLEGAVLEGDLDGKLKLTSKMDSYTLEVSQGLRRIVSNSDEGTNERSRKEDSGESQAGVNELTESLRNNESRESNSSSDDNSKEDESKNAELLQRSEVLRVVKGQGSKKGKVGNLLKAAVRRGLYKDK